MASNDPNYARHHSRPLSANTNQYVSQRSQDPPRNQVYPNDSHMASGSGYPSDGGTDDRKPKSKENESYNQQHLLDSDELTRSVVYELKRQIPNNQNIKGSSIERLVADIRRKQNPEQLDIKRWKKNLPSDIKQCRDSTLRSLMAYGDDPSQMATLLKKIDNESSNEDPTATSLENIIEPLKELRKDSNNMSSLNLFRIILDIDANEIDRADRMFYSEAYRLVKNLEGYTFDNAHDQVQAIRLMHYESDDRDELVDFIDKHRIFEDAYSHLQRLAKKRATYSNPNTTTQNRNYNQTTRSIIRQVSQDGNNNANTNDIRLFNTARPGSSSRQNSAGN